MIDKCIGRYVYNEETQEISRSNCENDRSIDRRTCNKCYRYNKIFIELAREKTIIVKCIGPSEIYNEVKCNEVMKVSLKENINFEKLIRCDNCIKERRNRRKRENYQKKSIPVSKGFNTLTLCKPFTPQAKEKKEFIDPDTGKKCQVVWTGRDPLS